MEEQQRQKCIELIIEAFYKGTVYTLPKLEQAAEDYDNTKTNIAKAAVGMKVDLPKITITGSSQNASYPYTKKEDDKRAAYTIFYSFQHMLWNAYRGLLPGIAIATAAVEPRIRPAGGTFIEPEKAFEEAQKWWSGSETYTNLDKVLTKDQTSLPDISNIVGLGLGGGFNYIKMKKWKRKRGKKGRTKQYCNITCCLKPNASCLNC